LQLAYKLEFRDLNKNNFQKSRQGSNVLLNLSQSDDVLDQTH